MLTRFEVKGFKAFKDSLVFDLRSRDYAFNPLLVRNGSVKNALVYGPNGIGKSCLGFAIFDLIKHLTDNMQFRQEYLAEYQNTGCDTSTPVYFRYDFNLDGDTAVYEYEKNGAQELISEKLTICDKLCLRWHYFDAAQCEIPALNGMGLQIVLPDNKLSVLKYVRRNLPTGTIPVLDKMMAFVDGMLWYRSLSEGNAYAGFTNGSAKLENVICKTGRIADYSSFLNENGLNYALSAKTIDNEERLIVEDPNTHRRTLFWNVASTGTKALTLFFYWSITAFKKISFLFIDEFDAFFHYQSAESILRRLNASDFQVVLTSHNTYLMQNDFTRPDCCFLMSHGEIRSLPDCTDREIREAHNLEKMYQNGAFSE